MAFASDLKKSDDRYVSSEILDCPICLEPYTTPRTLPCQHTFCETCIVSCLSGTEEEGAAGKTKLDCPLCRRETSSGNSLDASTLSNTIDWVQRLPLNYSVIRSLAEVGPKNESKNLCGACQTKCARYYCVQCKSFQCEDCKTHHNNFPQLRNHTIDCLDDFTPERRTAFNIANMEHCSTHTGEVSRFFCVDHSLLCCILCAVEDHRSCQEVASLKALGERLRSSRKPQQMERQMKYLQDQLGSLMSTVEGNVTSVDKQAKGLPRKMKKLHKTVTKLLDAAVDKVTQESASVKKEYTESLEERIATYKTLSDSISDLYAVLESVHQHGTDEQVFIVVKKLDDQVKRYTNIVSNVLAESSVVDLHLDLSTKIKELLQRSNDDVKVAVYVKPTSMQRCGLELGPVLEVQKQQDLKTPYYREAGYIGNGIIAAVDGHNNQCCVLDASCNVVRRVSVTHEPIRLVVLPNSQEVAITFQTSFQIQFVSFEGQDLELSRTVECAKQPICIAELGDDEFVVGFEKGLGVISTEGEESDFISEDSNGQPIKFSKQDRMAIDQHRHQVYQSSQHDNCLHSYLLDGEFVFDYHNDRLRDPRGVALDKDGNVYVCSQGNDCIHQLTPEGNRLRIIEIDIAYPTTICFSADSMLMMVMNLNYGTHKARTVHFTAVPHKVSCQF